MSMSAGAWVLKIFVALLVSGACLAVIVPMAHARGMSTPWLTVPVVLVWLAIFVGPDLRRAWYARQQTHTRTGI